MFKIISTEIKKIVSKPGIYILSFLIAVILVAGVFIYKPTVYENKQFELLGNNYLEKYAEFNQDHAGQKVAANKRLDDALKSINNYSITISSGTYTQEEYISLLKDKNIALYNEYQDSAKSNNPSYIANTTCFPALIGGLVTTLENFKLSGSSVNKSLWYA